MDKITEQEQDELILEELNIADDSNSEEAETPEEGTDENSTINTDEEESQEEETEGEEESESEEEPQKKPNKFAKLLAQRNEARREAEESKNSKDEAISQVQELQDKLEKLDSDGDYGSEEYVNTLVEKRMAEREETLDYFDEFEELRPYKKDILQYQKTNSVSLEQATKLHLLEVAPELLISPQVKAKQKTGIFKTPGRASKKLQTGKLDYSHKEFEEMAGKGLIKF